MTKWEEIDVVFSKNNALEIEKTKASKKIAEYKTLLKLNLLANPKSEKINNESAKKVTVTLNEYTAKLNDRRKKGS